MEDMAASWTSLSGVFSGPRFGPWDLSLLGEAQGREAEESQLLGFSSKTETPSSREQAGLERRSCVPQPATLVGSTGIMDLAESRLRSDGSRTGKSPLHFIFPLDLSNSQDTLSLCCFPGANKLFVEGRFEPYL